MPVKTSKPPKGPYLRFSCGHQEPQNHLLSKPCERCKQTNRKKKTGIKANRWLKNLGERPRALPAERGRLPHGSSYHLRYDAKAEKWMGMLIVPEAGEEGKDLQIPLSEKALFYLVQELDGKYRQAIAEKKEAK